MLRSNNPAVKAFFSFAIPLAAIEWRPLAFVELFNGVLKDLNARCRVEDRGVTLNSLKPKLKKNAKILRRGFHGVLNLRFSARALPKA